MRTAYEIRAGERGWITPRVKPDTFVFFAHGKAKVPVQNAAWTPESEPDVPMMLDFVMNQAVLTRSELESAARAGDLDALLSGKEAEARAGIEALVEGFM